MPLPLQSPVTIEPNWIGFESLEYYDYQIEYDANARPDSPERNRYRLRRYTGDPDNGWVFGLPPSPDGHA